ncbi:hypothetical protein OIDMADRAFT_25796 [Oidiodendron maius Zn]|uniref:PNPLA domain-containing protein n=1 Tax=Oidiodendron maius (strain Zn) TaxID=913774 RepID=A0A0C3HSK3_OIDMZ|nr:hypothetical protein OIDMADRAFT_25796 [Oidiodendron maius Zn]
MDLPVTNVPIMRQANERNFEHKPPTAGVRALIVEGGGVTGIIPLLILQELEAMVNLPIKIQEHFDIVIGKSSGAINTLALYSNEWSVENCLKQFQDISRDAFGRRHRYFGFSSTSLRRPGQILEAMLSHLGDSKYSSTGITHALTTAFGDRSLLFEASARGTKVGVVATTKDSSTCLFTNYNGPPEVRSPRCGYNLVRPEDSTISALASSATPPYFKPFQGYYDASLGDYNNLIDLALSEQDAVWSRQKKQPDIVVSLGIGFNKNNDPQILGAKQRTIPRARPIPRLFHSFSNSLVEEAGKQEVQNNLEPQARERHHRLDFEFSGDDLDLDNIQAMSAIREQIKSILVSNEAISRCADNVIASLFYLELRENQLFFDGTKFLCKGQIRCRLKPSSSALQVLITRLKESKAYFCSNFEHRLDCWYSGESEVVEHEVSYRREIEFKITSFEEFIDIKLDGITHSPMSISNCPYKIETLVKDQGLDLPFGSRLRVRRTQSQPAEYMKSAIYT